eukprot:7292967-Pyramimonas_sp.AAC.1
MASSRVIGEAIWWRVGDALAGVEIPCWPQDLMKSRTSYYSGEDCRTVALNLKESLPDISKAEDMC